MLCNDAQTKLIESGKFIFKPAERLTIDSQSHFTIAHNDFLILSNTIKLSIELY